MRQPAVFGSPGAGPYTYSISIDGRNVSVGGAQQIFFGIGDRFFVMTSDERVRDALLRALGLSDPIC
jgi:hypothetical protein